MILLSADIIQHSSFQKIHLGITIETECQTVWVQIMSDVLLIQIWIQTVYKDHHQAAKAKHLDG